MVEMNVRCRIECWADKALAQPTVLFFRTPMKKYINALLFILSIGTSVSAHAQSSEWKALNANVESLYEQGNYADAVIPAQKSLTLAEKLGPVHPDVATSLNNLALLYKTQGKYVQAEPMYKRSLTIRDKALGPDDPDVANSLNNLALL